MSPLFEIPAEDGLVITGAGLVTAVGHDRLSAASAIRADIGRFQPIPGFSTVNGGEAVGAMAYGMTDGRSGSDRLLAMAVPAAAEALAQAEAYHADLDPAAGRLILSLGAEERPRFEDFDSDDVATLAEETQIEAPKERTEVIRDGHAGGVLAIARAAALLYGDEVRHCVVGAMDSLVEYPALRWLDDARRLKTDDRPEGFLPGEAAAFLVLERRSEAARRGAPALAEIGCGATGLEKASLLSGEPLLGTGLAEVIAPTLEVVGGPVSGMLSDLNGEYYRMKEWGLASQRLFAGAGEVPPLWHPAECIGDVGAASAIAHVAVGTVALARGYFASGPLLVFASSDAGGRGSLILRAAS